MRDIVKQAKIMKYYSTNNRWARANFKDATLQGQAPDKGLYFPETIPAIPDRLIKNIENLSKEEIALEVIEPYVGGSIPREELKHIISETLSFDFPLVAINDSISSLELFHGPTLAFKDVGARFMSRCLGYFVKGEKKKITVLVATSGDTGGAVANGFYNVEGIEVVILYPSGKVSPLQEAQLTTLHNNISALEIEGYFDDCQNLVKQAFADPDLNTKLFLTSANSINIARWLPQQFYYFFAYQRWKDKKNPPVVSVPSGNFGNICAGLLAYRSGLPVKHFIAACNANNTVPLYLQSGNYQSQPSVSTLSNAMDVGNPSNFVRILEIFDHQLSSLKNILSSYSISDEETKATIHEVNDRYNYLLDPHGAVGYAALKHYLDDHPQQKGIVLETAHPVKFQDALETIIDKSHDMPQHVSEWMIKEKTSTKMKAHYSCLKDFLLRDQ